MLGGGDGGFSSYYYGCIKTFLVQTRKSLTGPGVRKCTPERLHCRTLDDLKRMGAAERPLHHPLTLLSRRRNLASQPDCPSQFGRPPRQPPRLRQCQPRRARCRKDVSEPGLETRPVRAPRLCAEPARYPPSRRAAVTASPPRLSRESAKRTAVRPEPEKRRKRSGAGSAPATAACVRACLRAYVRACVRVRVRACVRACVRSCVRACVCVSLPLGPSGVAPAWYGLGGVGGLGQCYR